MKKNLFLFLTLTLSKAVFCAASNPSEIKSLHHAAKKGDLEGTLRLLNTDTINHQNNAEKTPLILAVENGHREVAQLLLKHKAKTEVKDSHGMTALMHGAYKGHLGIVEDLISHDAHVNAQDNENWTPLMFSILEKHFRICKLLIAYNADPNISNSDGDSSISLAGLSKNSEALEILLTGSLSHNMLDSNITDGNSFFNAYKREIPY